MSKNENKIDICEMEPSSELLMSTVNCIMRDIAGNLAEFLISRFGEMKFNGHFAISSFLKEYGYSASTQEYNLFNSSYQKEILKKVDHILFVKGYNCSIVVEDRSITYNARIMNSKRTLAAVGMLTLPVIFGINYLYDMYVNNQLNGYF